jgi:hypothetical protein
MFAWRTDDGGRSFSAPLALVPEGVPELDHPGIATGAGQAPAQRNVYLAWAGGADDRHPNDLGFTRSTDGGPRPGDRACCRGAALLPHPGPALVWACRQGRGARFGHRCGAGHRADPLLGGESPSVTWAADGRTFIIVDNTYEAPGHGYGVRFYRLRVGPDGRAVRLDPLRIKVWPSAVDDVALSPDGSRLAIAEQSQYSRIQVRSLATGATKTWRTRAPGARGIFPGQRAAIRSGSCGNRGCTPRRQRSEAGTGC